MPSCSAPAIAMMPEQYQCDQVAHPHTRHQQHTEGDRHEHDERAEVGLQQDQTHRHSREGQRFDQRPQAQRLLAVVVEVRGEHQDQRDLGQLGGLELHRAEDDPRLGALDGVAEHQHVDQRQQGRDVADRGPGAEDAVVEEPPRRSCRPAPRPSAIS